MTKNAESETTVENAYKDIDRYVSEMSAQPSTDPRWLSPSERLRALGKPRPQRDAEEGPLLANKF